MEELSLNLNIKLPVIRWLALLTLMLSLSPVSQAIPNDVVENPRDLVMRTSQELLQELQNNREAINKDPELAYRLADKIIIPHVDFNLISRIVLGRYWRDADEKQRQRFMGEFRQLLTHTYVTAMVTYVDQILALSKDVTYLPLRMQEGDDDVTVRSEIALEKATKIPVLYSLRMNDAKQWQIYDVSIDGISLATTYRSSFGSQVRREGLDVLLQRLAEKNSRYNQQEVIQTSQ
jgi:phospholipid transport system substrate-binding protein